MGRSTDLNAGLSLAFIFPDSLRKTGGIRSLCPQDGRTGCGVGKVRVEILAAFSLAV